MQEKREVLYSRKSYKRGEIRVKANTKAKWIVGLTGTAFSAFMISQLDQPILTDTETEYKYISNRNNEVNERARKRACTA